MQGSNGDGAAGRIEWEVWYSDAIDYWCVEYYIDGWLKRRNDGSGSFYSLKLKPVEQRAKPAGDSARTQRRFEPETIGRDGVRRGGRPELDDEVPF